MPKNTLRRTLRGHSEQGGQEALLGPLFATLVAAPIASAIL